MSACRLFGRDPFGRNLLPVGFGNAVEVPNHLSVTDGQLAFEFLCPDELSSLGVDEPEPAVPQVQDGQVCRGTDAEMTEIRAFDLLRGIPRGPPHSILERHSKIEEFRDDVDHVLHAGVHAVDVQVRADRIGGKPLGHCRHRMPERETGSAVPGVKYDATLARLASWADGDESWTSLYLDEATA